MGIVPTSLDFLNRHLPLVGGLNNCRMMELGNQQMYWHPNIPEGSAAKSWFERMGVRHTSIDSNGELGSIKLDLSLPIERPEWIGTFDVVTDFGTGEHIGINEHIRKPLEGLYQCRANCHRWCRLGGIMLFMNPKTGHWPLHGFHYFTVAHYQQLAEACSYTTLELSEHPSGGNYVDGLQIHAALQKVSDVPFVTREQFTEICNSTVFPA